jgi:hypothetical protein
MTCAVHPEAAAVAYCRTCGKAMCEKCTHSVKGVVYCEDCLAARLQGTLPAAAPAAGAAPIEARSLPSPGLAAVLAGFFPFGVASVYTGQYAKGLAHLLIFAFLVWGLSNASGGVEPLLGIALAFFYIYQIVDAFRSAQAIQKGQPAPDPFGLGKTFTAGDKVDVSKAPLGAFILIGLGVLFLLSNMGLLRFWWMGRLWPLVLIFLGVWMFIRRCGPSGQTGC